MKLYQISATGSVQNIELQVCPGAWICFTILLRELWIVQIKCINSGMHGPICLRAAETMEFDIFISTQILYLIVHFKLAGHT